MSLHIKQITDPKIWSEFLRKQLFTPFVQSPTHGVFYDTMGESHWIFGVYEHDQLIGGSLVLSTHAKRGSFLFLPYGPILDYTRSDIFQAFVDYLTSFAKKHGYAFLRISPFVDDTPEVRKLFRDAGFRDAPLHVLAETTWLLPLYPPEETLLQNMNKNHRNLIRRCQREGVVVHTSEDPADISQFNALLDVTAQRHKFHRYSSAYVEKQFRTMIANKEAILLLGTLPDGTLDAGAIIMFCGSMAAYYHGASLGQDKKLPVSYFVQWTGITEAKKRGMTYYNFWGIAPDGAPKQHPFFGITHFKKGFGGEKKQLLHCQDLPLSTKYSFTWLIEQMRKIRRGF